MQKTISIIYSVIFLTLTFLTTSQTFAGSERFTCANNPNNPVCPNGIDWGAVGDSMETRIETLEAQAANSVQTIGTIITSAYNGCPAGAIKANGQSTSGYPALAALVGGRVPDLRGEFIRGFDDGRGVDSGRGFGSFQADELESHNHKLLDGVVRGAHGAPGGQNSAYSAGPYGLKLHFTNNSGGNETRPRNIALLYCIVAN